MTATARNLALVPPADPEPVEPVHIDEQWRQEIRRRDWGRVILDAERNPPVSLARRIWSYTMPTARKGI